MRLRRREKAPAAVREVRGALAWAEVADGGWLVGTRDELVHVHEGATRLAWSDVQAADWSQDAATLTVLEVGEYGLERARHVFGLEDAALLLQLVRERVQASIVLQRHAPVHGKHGVTVVARRRSDGTLAWLVEYDEGIDPDSPQTVRIVETALALARGEVGG